jgi:hypothetical protein
MWFVVKVAGEGTWHLKSDRTLFKWGKLFHHSELLYPYLKTSVFLSIKTRELIILGSMSKKI